ncbi:helical backbone metal receptor [Methanoplanus limicola]|uniref:ABC-type transporter, periplasmic subunit n=1 Tax=Methanoplanus limicola DSM 2279 TaxID=937775 RepID=H1Z433_9EURY|nr:helical backbone metal receptor [Methanoplanus limicola]EHQ35712.1 ABC-type transporter, periplasmic subunit [Methanoplanus limicola DSM 2279]
MRKKLLSIFLTVLLLVLVCPADSYPMGLSDQEITGSINYMKSCQKSDGGFGESDRDSNPGTSTWVMLALSAAGDDLSECKSGGVSAIDYLKSIAPETVALDGTSETSKMILTLIAAGEDPRSFEGADFVSLLKSKEKDSGQYGDHIYTTNWAVMALSAAGEDVSKSIQWLESQQNDDGGFGWTIDAESDNDDTSSAVMALCSAGRSSSDSSVKSAMKFFRNSQGEDGGFNYGGSSSSNTASDSWVIQALIAAGEDPTSFIKNGKSPVDNLLTYRTDDGYFMWTSLLTDNPCRMTSAAVPALLGLPYPIKHDDHLSVAKTSTGSQSGSTPAALSSDSDSASGSGPAVSPEDSDRVVTVIDDFGKEIEIKGYPQRIISLAPANTEILYALGLGDKIVGVTDYCNYPAEAVNVEKVGGYSTPNVEKIVAAKPDLIVASFGNTEEVANKLRNMGFVVISTNPTDISDVLNDITIIGEATGTESKAKEIVSDMESRINSIRTKAAGADEHPTVAHIVWYDPVWVSGSDTFQNEMFEIISAKNAFPEVKGWGTVSLEEFVVTNPDVIVVSSGTGMGEEGRDVIYNYLMEESRFKNMNAVKNNRVYVVDADIIDRGGPRIVEGLEEVAADVYPDLFTYTEKSENNTSESAPLGISVVMSLIAGLSVVFLRRREKA